MLASKKSHFVGHINLTGSKIGLRIVSVHSVLEWKSRAIMGLCSDEDFWKVCPTFSRCWMVRFFTIFQRYFGSEFRKFTWYWTCSFLVQVTLCDLKYSNRSNQTGLGCRFFSYMRSCKCHTTGASAGFRWLHYFRVEFNKWEWSNPGALLPPLLVLQWAWSHLLRCE